MATLKQALRWLAWLIGGTVLLAAAAVAWALWAWRDIPVAELEARYGAGARVATVDGVPIRYRLDGPQQAPTLVLVHSHFFDMGMWDGWLPQLTPHFRVLRYDLSGHGLTGPDPSGVYSVDRDVALLDGLLAQLGIGELTLAGSSTGGTIAYHLAAAQPARVRALVLINSGGLKKAYRRRGDSLPPWAAPVLRLVPPAALHKFLRWMIADDALVTEALKARFVDLWRREGNRGAEYARLRQSAFGDPDATLGRITAPTLVLWGQDNPQLPPELATEFERKLTAAARVQVKVYPGAAHVLQLERPQESAADVLDFMVER